MINIKKRNILKVKLESIFRRMKNGEPVNDDERYLYFTVKGLNEAQTDDEAIEEYLYSLSLTENLLKGVVA